MTAERVVLRRARPDDAALLERWERDPDVAGAQGGDAGLTVWTEEIALGAPWQDVLIAEAGGRPVGVVVDIDPAAEETHYWGDCGPGLRAFDIWIGEADARGRGIGSEMMRLAVARAFSDPAVDAVIVDPLASNARAIRFYERFGFRAVARRRFGADDCLVMRLARRAL